MNTQVFPQGTDEKIKSYWKRPGGKFGTIVGLGILGLIGYYLFPIATTIIWNTVNLAIAAAVAFALYMFLSNRKLWLSVFYLYEILIKKLVGVVIELDPFIIAEDYIKEIEEERERLLEKSNEVDAQKESIELSMKEREREKNKQLNIAAVAKQKGQGPELVNATRQIKRLDDFIAQLTPIRDNLHRIGEYLTQVHKNSRYMLEDMKNDLEIKKATYHAVTKGNSAVKSAMAIFSGDVEKRLMVEQSMDYLKNDVASKLASMKKAISYSADFMKSIDLENASYEMEGLKMLEEYKPELFSYNANGEPIHVPVSTTVNPSRYENLIQ